MVTFEVPNLSKFLRSCLIDNNCTCAIKVVKHVDENLSTFSCLTHYGHDCELQSVWIAQKNRREIAAKLQQGVPRENILDTIRNSVGDQILREHRIDDQDVKNIKKSFGIDTVHIRIIRTAFCPGLKNGVKMNIPQYYFSSFKVNQIVKIDWKKIILC